jgi:hypothetical protein
MAANIGWNNTWKHDIIERYVDDVLLLIRWSSQSSWPLRHISQMTMDLLLFTYMFSFLYHCQDCCWTWLYISVSWRELLTLREHMSSPQFLFGFVLLIVLASCVVLLCVVTFWLLCCDVLLIVLTSCVVLLCVVTFWLSCCDVRYDFCIKTMFG